MTVKAWDMDAKTRIISERGCGWTAWRWVLEEEDGAVLMSRSFPTARAALDDMEDFLSEPKEWGDE